MESHITRVKDKLNKCNAIPYKASAFHDSAALRTLYYSLYLPYINYCSEVWGNTLKTALDCIVKAQKRAIRIVSKVKFREHTNGLFCKLQLLKFEDLVTYKIAINMYNANLNVLPPNIQRCFSNYLDSAYSLRSYSLFKVSRARTSFKSYCLSVYGVKVFNRFPKNIVSAKNVS